MRSVLVVTKRFATGFGGIPESILLLAKALGSYGKTLDVISQDGFRADVGRMEMLPPAGARQARRDAAAVDLRRYASVYIAGSWNIQALGIAIRARHARIPVIYSPKGNLAPAEFKRWRDLKKIPYLFLFEWILFALSERIVASSTIERATLVAPCSRFDGKVCVVPEPFVGPALTRPGEGRDEAPRFGFLAEIAPRKGLRELVRAFIALQTQTPSAATLHIVGEPRPGSEAYLAGIRQEVAASGMQGSIVFRGALRGAARDAFYEEIAFLVCPTYFESFGLTLLESLWRGVPVIATRGMGVLEFLPPDAPVIVTPGNGTAELLAALTLAIDCAPTYLRRAYSWRARQIAAVSLASIGQAFADIFDTINRPHRLRVESDGM